MRHGSVGWTWKDYDTRALRMRHRKVPAAKSGIAEAPRVALKAGGSDADPNPDFLLQSAVAPATPRLSCRKAIKCLNLTLRIARRAMSGVVGPQRGNSRLLPYTSQHPVRCARYQRSLIVS